MSVQRNRLSMLCSKKHLFLSLAIMIAAITPGLAAPMEPTWPQFRGPHGSGVAAEDAAPPWKIGPQEGILWKVDVPWSPSSPCLDSQRIYLTTFDGGKLETRAYDANTGALLWNQGLEAKTLEVYHRSDGSPAASTPATNGRRVVSYFGSVGLVCYDSEGRELWRHPLPVALSGGQFGTGTSPIIHGNLVLLNRDQMRASSLLALDLETGKTVWESPRPEAFGSFGSPVVWAHDGREEIVVAGALWLKGYDLASGREQWMIKGLTPLTCTTPVVGDAMLYYAAWSPGNADSPWPEWSVFQSQHDKNKDGVITYDEFPDQARDFYRGMDANADGRIEESDWKTLIEGAKRGKNQLIAVKPGGHGDITESHVAWKYERGLPYVSSPLFYQGRVYLVRDGGQVTSIDATTGRAYYAQERVSASGSYYASPVAGNGRIYLASLPGKLTVIKAGGDHPEILHQADFDERILATPALVSHRLYLRTQTKLYAFEAGR